MSAAGSGDGEPLTLEQLADDVNFAEEYADRALGSLEDRISRIEEIIAARWPRGIFLRRRLARELRASVAGLDERAPGLPAGFRGRRAEVTGQWLAWEMMQRRSAGRAPGC